MILEYDDIVVSKDFEENLANERFVNKLTAEFLMPKNCINKMWSKDSNPALQLSMLARKLKVSRLALVIRLRDLNFVNDLFVETIVKETDEDVSRRNENADGGPNFYRVLNSKLSKSFTQSVMIQAESGKIAFTQAFRLLGIKGKTYDAFKERIYKI